MDKTLRNYFLKNLDAYYFAVNTFLEFPGMEEKTVRQAMYDEFGYDRFSNKTFYAYCLVQLAKDHF